MRLDHLLSKGKSRGCVYCLVFDDKDISAIERMGNHFPVPMRAGETPVPIPNTTVKPCAAEGTMPVTAWENRRAPEYMGV